MIGRMIAALRGRLTAQRTVREVLGQPRKHGGALVIERPTTVSMPCDLCKRHQRTVLTVLVPVVRGNSRPRIQQEAHQTFTACLRCVLRAAFRVRFGIVRRSTYA